MTEDAMAAQRAAIEKDVPSAGERRALYDIREFVY
jgi:hypothetical protein